MAVSLSGMSLHTNNDNEGGWGGTDGPDDYNNAEQGTNSESMLVSKNATETATLTKSSALPTTRGLFTFWMATSLAPYYTDIELDLESTSNNLKKYTVTTAANREISGDFKPVAVDYVNNGAETGTFAAASFSLLRLIIDNSSSGNIRSVINVWIDAMYYGVGHTISGTTADDQAFKEAADVDELTANKYGVMWNYNDSVYCQGDLALSGTLTSKGESLTFIDNSNGYDVYNLDITGTVDFENTSITAAGTARVNVDTSSATSFSMKGGTIKRHNTLVTAAGQTMDGIVFQDGLTSTIANTLDKATFNLCGKITISGAGKLTNSTINQSTDAIAMAATNLNDAEKCTFISDGTGHAFDLGSVAATTAMDWDNSDSGYASSDGTTGNETILVNVASGQTLTINVSATATTPTIKNDGTGTVTVVAGQKSFAFALNPSITGYEWRIYTVTAAGSLAGAVEIAGEEVASADNQSYSYSYSVDTPIAVQIISGSYQESTTFYTLENSDKSVTILLETEENV